MPRPLRTPVPGTVPVAAARDTPRYWRRQCWLGGLLCLVWLTGLVLTDARWPRLLQGLALAGTAVLTQQAYSALRAHGTADLLPAPRVERTAPAPVQPPRRRRLPLVLTAVAALAWVAGRRSASARGARGRGRA